jgi:acyl dehydratase
MGDAENFLRDLKAKTGEEMGLTQWYCYDQAAVSSHAATSGDDGPIHNDPDYCKANTPFGGTIVQGSLLLSTFTRMAKSLVWPEGEMVFRLSYGFNKVRIIQPVKTGQMFRARFHLKHSEPKGVKAALVTLDASFEAEGSQGAVLAAEWLVYLQFSS